MLSLPKENVLYYFKANKNYFLLFLSTLQGWGLVELTKTTGFVKNTQLVSWNATGSTKSFQSFLCNTFFGFFKSYQKHVRLIGMGFKSLVVSKTLLLKIGYSHRISYVAPLDIRLRYVTRQLFTLESRQLSVINELFYGLHTLIKPNAYKKKGVFFKGSILKIKASSKKSKF